MIADVGEVGATVGGEVLVWAPRPDAGALMGALPDRVRLATWEGQEFPAGADEVEFCIVPFSRMGPSLAELDRLPRLRVLQTLSAGFETVAPYVPPGVMLCNARGAHAGTTAEWVVMAMLAAVRDLPRLVRAQDAGRWDGGVTQTLVGKTVLILGYGSIGAAVEDRLSGFEVEVVRVARHARDGVHPVDDLPDLLPRADVVVVLVPLTDDTHHLVDAAFLARMHDGALLVNAARGGVVDTEALLAELASGRLRAALDVTDPEPLPAGHPLWSAPGLLLTPHVGGHTPLAMPRAFALAGEQVRRYAAGEPLRNVVVPAEVSVRDSRVQ